MIDTCQLPISAIRSQSESSKPEPGEEAAAAASSNDDQGEEDYVRRALRTPATPKSNATKQKVHPGFFSPKPSAVHSSTKPVVQADTSRPSDHVMGAGRFAATRKRPWRVKGAA